MFSFVLNYCVSGLKDKHLCQDVGLHGSGNFDLRDHLRLLI